MKTEKEIKETLKEYESSLIKAYEYLHETNDPLNIDPLKGMRINEARAKIDEIKSNIRILEWVLK